MWFLEISCQSLLVFCIGTAQPNPEPQRWYESKSQCDVAAVEVAKKWNPGEAAWTFKCLPTAFKYRT